MARRGIPKTGPSWFIKEWMDISGVRQRDMVERCDWSKATASQIYNGVQDYSPKVVQEAALALNVEPFELLMHPDRAMALRKLRASAEEIVTIAHNAKMRYTNAMEHMDDLRDEVKGLRDELRDLRIYARYLEHELDRRSDWLVNSIWGVDAAVSQLIVLGGMVFVLSQIDGEAWGLKALAAALAVGAFCWFHARRYRLQETDKKRIREGSIIDR